MSEQHQEQQAVQMRSQSSSYGITVFGYKLTWWMLVLLALLVVYALVHFDVIHLPGHSSLVVERGGHLRFAPSFRMHGGMVPNHYDMFAATL